MSTKAEPKDEVRAEAEGDPALLSDPEDYLEEHESLDMNLASGNQKVWLVKLPRYLADKWTVRANLRGQQLGQIKIKQTPKPAAAPGGRKKLEVKLVLDEAEVPDHFPQEYQLQILNTHVRNSYVFSEENLKRFKQEVTELSDMPEQPRLKEIDREQLARPDQFFNVQKNGSDERATVPFVKTIPKKTKLVGRIVHDCQVIPLKDDKRYLQMLQRKRHIGSAAARPKVTFLTEIPGVVQLQAGPSLLRRTPSMFLKTNAPKNKADGRAIRMPQKELLDLLFRLFEEYEYWSMKGLKERTRQPETYLKESLELIANLIKKGPYTSKYNLKPEYKRLRDAERAARMGEDVKKEDDDNDDEDDDMEDVI